MQPNAHWGNCLTCVYKCIPLPVIHEEGKKLPTQTLKDKISGTRRCLRSLFLCYFHTIPSRWEPFLSASFVTSTRRYEYLRWKAWRNTSRKQIFHITTSYVNSSLRINITKKKILFLFVMQKHGYCIYAHLHWNVILFLFQMQDWEPGKNHTTDHEPIKCMDLSWKTETAVYTELVV